MHRPRRADNRRYKSQSAVEYLSIYGWVIIALAVFLAIAYVLISGNTTPTTSYCYISPGLTCMQTFVISNSVTSKAVVLFQNNLGVKMEMATNPFSFADPYSASIYSGKCYPNIVPPGGIVTCNATLSNFQQPTGTQVNPKFSLKYQLCDPVCGSSVFSTSGSASVFTSSSSTNLFLVTLVTSPSTGKISVGGVSYANGTTLYFIGNQSYVVYAVPPAGYAFGQWLTTNSLRIGGQSQSTTATTGTLGTLTAQFNFVTSSTSSTSTTSTSTSTTSTTTSTSTSSTSTSTSSTSTSTSTSVTTTSTSTSTTSTSTSTSTSVATTTSISTSTSTTVATTSTTASTTSTVLNDCSGGAPNRVSCSQGLGCGYDGCPAYQGGVATWTCQGYGNVQCGNNGGCNYGCSVGYSVSCQDNSQCCTYANGCPSCTGSTCTVSASECGSNCGYPDCCGVCTSSC